MLCSQADVQDLFDDKGLQRYRVELLASSHIYQALSAEHVSDRSAYLELGRRGIKELRELLLPSSPISVAKMNDKAVSGKGRAPVARTATIKGTTRGRPATIGAKSRVVSDGHHTKADSKTMSNPTSTADESDKNAVVFDDLARVSRLLGEALFAHYETLN